MRSIKIRKTIALCVLAVTVAITAVGCGKKDSERPMGSQLAQEFHEIAKVETGTEAIAGKLAESKLLEEIGMATMPVEEGFLNGFDAEITGFSEGCMFAPMIGSIPFVGYVFETEDTKALTETLQDHAQLNWNICTTADEMVTDVDGSYVFFVMAPEKFE